MHSTSKLSESKFKLSAPWYCNYIFIKMKAALSAQPKALVSGVLYRASCAGTSGLSAVSVNVCNSQSFRNFELFIKYLEEACLSTKILETLLALALWDSIPELHLNPKTRKLLLTS